MDETQMELIREQIKEINRNIDGLLIRPSFRLPLVVSLSEKLAKMESLEYIHFFEIKAEDIEHPLPNHVNHFDDFSHYLDGLGSSAKKWAGWGGDIHRTSAVARGECSPTPARLKEIEELEESK